MQIQGPTFLSELKRGVNLYNLSVALLASVVVGILFYFLISSGLFSAIPTEKAANRATGIAVVMFFLTTVLHTLAHSYFGWRFSRGITASRNGEHAKALRLLAPVERRGMDHYDLGHHAAKALQVSRSLIDGQREDSP